MYDKKKRPLFYPGRPNGLTSPSSQVYRNAYLGLSNSFFFSTAYIQSITKVTSLGDNGKT